MTNGIGRVGWRNFVSVAPTTASIITTGLVLNLDAGNVASYSGTGTTWTDLSGNGNNATLYNGAVYNSANSGTMVFDGINDYATTSTGIFNNSSFSYNGWFKFSSLVGGIFQYQTNNNGFRLVANSDGTIFFRLFFTNGTYSSETTSTQLTTGIYKHISLNFELGVGAKIYVNGILVHTYNTTLTPQYATSPFFSIGGGDWSGHGNYNSNNIQVYNKALSSTEVLQNFDATKSRYGFTSYTTRTTAFATATGITDTTILNALNTFDTGLISNGLDTKMKALYPFVGGTANTHKFNFMDARDVNAAFRLAFNGGWIHSSTGAKPNGTNAYADSFWIASAQSTNDNISYNYYSRTNTSGAANFGGSGEGYFGTTAMYISLNGASNYATINGMGYLVTSSTDSRGLFGINTTTNNIFTSWKNGNKSGTRNYTTDGYFGITNVSLWIGGCKAPSAEYGNMECAFFNMSTGLSDSEQSTFYNLVQTLQTALNRQV